MSKIIGRCVGETSLSEISFISKETPQVGEYVSLTYDKKNVLGMIESLFRGSVSINDEIYDPKAIAKIREIEGDDYYIRGKVKILGDINDNLRIPRTPAPPGTEVKAANSEILKEIFKIDGGGLRLGNLISQDQVEVEIDINKMVSRHLAILAMTGAGKSNTVAVVVDGLLEYNGCVVIFDMHSEYTDIHFKNGKLEAIEAQINPLYMSCSEIKRLARIPENAYLQDRYFREACKIARKEANEANIKGRGFVKTMKTTLEGWSNEEKFRGQDLKTQDKKTIIDVLNKIEDLEERYNQILNLSTGNILSKLKLNSANVIDLGSVDESAAEVIVSHVLRNALEQRKNFIRKEDRDEREILSHPVFFVLEEAHILAPKSRSPRSKYWISRIAREGRKFGLGIALVSQSPKSLDPDSLSQANNMIILRLVEPQDQRHVQTASESLSDDLVSQLPSLNIGEAVVLGLMTRIPTLVKIDDFGEGKSSGGDINIVGEWEKSEKTKKRNIENQKQEFMETGGDY
jgi:uncharacterized protein